MTICSFCSSCSCSRRLLLRPVDRLEGLHGEVFQEHQIHFSVLSLWNCSNLLIERVEERCGQVQQDVADQAIDHSNGLLMLALLAFPDHVDDLLVDSILPAEEANDRAGSLEQLGVRALRKECLSNLLLDHPLPEQCSVQMLSWSDLYSARPWHVSQRPHTLGSTLGSPLPLSLEEEPGIGPLNKLTQVRDALKSLLEVRRLEEPRREGELNLLEQLRYLGVSLCELEEGAEGCEN